MGVRGMKLGAKDFVENVYFISNSIENSVIYKGKTIDLNKLKAAKRDGKGTKIRI